MAAQITVDVGVQLNVLQSSINELKSILSKLEIDSSSFKKVSSLIDSMSNSMQKFQTQTSKAFTSQGQFDKAQGTLEKIEETLNRTQQAIKNIKFSDLKLDNSQLDSFKQLVSNLDEAKTTYSNFLSSLKSQATAEFDLKNLGINASDMKGSLEEVQAAITRVIENAKSALTGLETKLNTTKSQLENISNLAKSASTSTSGLPSDFDKYLNKNGTGFKGGKISGKKEIIQQLKEQFTLTDTEVTALLNSTFNEIKQAFQEWANNADELIPDNLFSVAANRLRTKVNDFSTKVNATKAQISGLEQLQTNVDVTFNTETAQTKLKELEERLAQTEAELEKYKNAQVSAATSAPAMTSASDSIKNSLQGLVTQLEQTNVAFTQMQQRVQTLNGIKQAIINFTGFNSVMNLVKSAVKEAATTIKELDSIMNTISIVTNMTTSDLWKQVGVYSEMAQNYGVSIKGAYEVSKIYYQQGLQTNDVLSLTNETLKLCKISGLDYSTTTDYMTTALRGFKMEMSEASTIVDVYSSLASTTAVSQGELAEAMSKTASSLESVGTTFQEASSMIATMVAVTRESATNIGSALKSIAARYGELTKSTEELGTDADGQVVSFNKVDKALQTVGITMQTTDGQFRKFTDVITELSGKWDQLSSTQQRYIATQFAGNRQQSRFLALVSNGELLQQNLNTANTSEGLGTAQALKAMDSLESKLAQLKTAYQQFYVSMGAENVWKAALTGITNFTNSLNSLPKLFGTIPVSAIAIITSGAKTISNLLVSLVSKLGATLSTNINAEIRRIDIKTSLGEKAREAVDEANNQFNNANISGVEEWGEKIKYKVAAKKNEISNILSEMTSSISTIKLGDNINWSSDNADITNYKNAVQGAIDKLVSLGVISQETGAKLKNMAPNEAAEQLRAFGQGVENTSQKLTKIGESMGAAGSAITLLANFLNDGSRDAQRFSGSLTVIGGALATVSALAKAAATSFKTIPWVAIASGVITIISGIATAVETQEEKITRLKKEAEDLSNTAKQVKADEKTLQSGYDQLKRLEAARYESAEAAQEYQKQVDNLADSFPELITGFDSAGNAIINTKDLELSLAEARKKTAQATLEAIQKEKEYNQEQLNEINSNIQGYGDIAKIHSDDSDTSTEYIQNNLRDAMEQQELNPDFFNFRRNGLSVGSLGTASESLTLAIKNLFSLADSSMEEINGYTDIINNSILPGLKQELEDLNNLQIQTPEDKAYKSQLELVISYVEQLEGAILEPENLDEIYNFVLTKLSDLDLTTSTGQQDALEFVALIEKLDAETRQHLTDYFKDLGIDFEKLISEMRKGLGLAGKDSNLDYSESSIQLQLYASTYNEALNQIITKYSQIGNMLSRKIYEDWKVASAETGESLEDYYKNGNVKDVVDAFTSAMNDITDESTKTFLNQASTLNYTAQDILEILESKGAINENNRGAIESAVNALFDNGEAAVERVTNQLNLSASAINESDNASKGNEIFATYQKNMQIMMEAIPSVISERLANFINSQTSKIQQAIISGNYETASNIESFTRYITSQLMLATAEERDSILTVLTNANLNTIEGLQAAIKSLESIEGYENNTAAKNAVKRMEEQMKTLGENVALSYDAYLSSITETIEADQKEMSKLSSGMSITEAQALLSKVKSLDDKLDWSIGDQIVASGDKFVLSAKGAQEYIDAYRENLKDEADKANQAYNNLQGELDNLHQLNNVGEYFNKIKNILKTYANYSSEDLSKMNNLELLQALNDYKTTVEEAKEKYENDSNAIIDASTRSIAWAYGIYTDAWETLGITAENEAELFEKKTEALKNYKVGSEKYNELDSITRSAIQKMRSGISSLLSDYISKAGEIDFSAYENTGIDKDILEVMKNAKNANLSFTEYIQTFVDASDKTVEEINNLLVQAKALDTKTATKDALKSIITSYDNFTYEVAAKYASAIGVTVTDLLANSDKYGIIKNDIGGYQIDYEEMVATLREKFNAGEILQNEYNEMLSQLNAAKYKSSSTKNNAISTIIANRNKLTDENILALADSLKLNYDEIFNELKLTLNSDGTSYSVNLSSLQDLIKNHEIELNDEIKESIASLIDDNLTLITNSIASLNKGTNSFSEMQQVVNQINKTIKDADYNIDDLYTYDATLKAYKLNETGFISYFKTLNAQLSDVTTEQQKIIRNTISNELQSLAQNIDINSYINEIGSTTHEARNQVIKMMENYNLAAEASGKYFGLAIEEITNALEKGGTEAVLAAKQVARAQGKTLTAEEISTIYNSAITRLNNVLEQSISSVGTVVDKAAADAINNSGGYAERIGNTGQFLVKQMGDLYTIYKNTLDEMSKTTGATLEQMNSIAAKMLESRTIGDSKTTEQNVIDILSDAANLTYTRFGEILAENGVKLTEELIEQLTEANVIKQLGGNKMSIIDFSALADIMGWDANSEEYISAFKTYNDSLINMNRQAEKTISDEISSLSNAKGGDWLNITQLWSTLTSDLQNELNSELSNYGAILNNGILKLNSDANIAGVIATLTDYAQQYGNLLQSDVAKLADTLDEVLKSFASSIETALAGSLTKSGAVDLTNMVKSLGLENVQLDFTETANGLKLSYQSAEKLCIELKKSNNEAGQLVFDKVYDSLVSTSGEFSNIQKTSMRIKDTQDEIRRIDSEINSFLSKANENTNSLSAADAERVSILKKQKDNLQDQLSLYDQIKKRQANDADSYNFMNNKAPSYLDGVTNYWNSVGTAFKSMNSAASSGYMSIQDFHNIINEMNSLAASTGQKLEFMGKTLDGSSKSAADLINQGMGYLENVDGEGVKVNLSKFGVDISSGADSMQDGFQQGIKTMAKQQIALLDAAIQMLEVIVKMEELGDIDVDNNGIFSIGDIFKYEDTDDGQVTKYTEQFKDWAQNVLEASKTNNDLSTALDSFSVNGISLRKMLDDTSNDLYQLNLSEDVYFAALDALVKAAKSGDYSESSLDSVWEIIKDYLPKDGQTFTFNNGNVAIVMNDKTKYTIDWERQSNQDLIDYVKGEINGDETAAKEAILQAVQRAENGTGSIIDVAYSYAVKPNSNITFNKDGTISIKGKSGTYSPGTAEFTSAIQQEALLAAGIDKESLEAAVTKAEEEGTLGEIDLKASITAGNTEIDVIADKNGNVKYLDDKGNSYNTLREAQDAIIENQLTNNREYQIGSESERKQIRGQTYYATFGFNPELEFNVEMDENTTNEQAKEAALQIQNMGENALKAKIEELEPDRTGKVTLKINDNISFSGDKTEIQGKVSEWAAEQLQGIDSTIANSITTALSNEGVINAIATAVSQGISEAFSLGFKTVKDKDNTDVKSAAEGAAGAAAADAAEVVQNTEFSIPAITVKTDSITIDTSGVTTPTLSNASGVTDNIPIETVTLNATNATINITNTPTTTPTSFDIPDLTATGTDTALTLDFGENPSPTVNQTSFKLSGLDATGQQVSLTVDSFGNIAPYTGSAVTVTMLNAQGVPTLFTVDPSGSITLLKSGTVIENVPVSNAEGDVGTLTVTVDNSTATNLSENSTKPTLSSVEADATSASIEAQSYKVTFANDTTGSSETVTVSGFANLQAILASYGVGFTNNNGAIYLAQTGTINTAADTTGLDNDLDTYAQEKTIKIKTGMDTTEITGEKPEMEVEPKINTESARAAMDSLNQTIADTGGAAGTFNEKVANLSNALAQLESDATNKDNIEAFTTAYIECVQALENNNLDGTAYASNLEAIGNAIPDGLVTSINNGQTTVDTAGTTLMQALLTAMRTAGDIASPSGVTQEYGGYLVEGLVNGLQDTSSLTTAASTLMSAVISQISTEISATDWTSVGSQVSSDLASGLSSNKEHIVTATKTLVSAVTDNLDFSNVSTSISEVDVKSIDKATYDKILKIEDIKEGKANVKNVTIGANAVTASKTLSSLQSLDFSTTTSSLSGIKGNLDKIGGVSFSNFDTLKDKLVTATTQAETLWSVVQKFANQTFTVNLNQTGGETTRNTTENKTVNETKNTTETKTVNNVSNTTVNVDTSSAQTSAKNLAAVLSSTLSPAITVAKTRVGLLSDELNKIPSKAILVSSLASAMNQLPTGKASLVANLATQMSKIPDIGNKLYNLVNAMRNIPTGTKSLVLDVTVRASGSNVNSASTRNRTNMYNYAKGNVALAKGNKNVLMGELGPELVVSSGRYYVVGNAGPEFVNLPDDAIVFNHLQTKKLISGQKVNGRGEPVTTEKKAVSFATGNASGDALASASAALAALKEIREAWKTLASASSKTLGSLAGKDSGSKSGSGSNKSSGSSGKGNNNKGGSGKSGSGKSGSGSGTEDTYKPVQYASVTEAIERWYNLTRQIEALEKEITYQQALRNKYETDRIANGEKIYETYQNELWALEKEISNQKELVSLQKSFYDNKRNELAASQYSKIFTYDENGLQQYTSNAPGSKRGLDILEELTRRDANGKLINNAVNAIAQLDYLTSVGFNINVLRYNDNGTLASDYTNDYNNILIDKNGNRTWYTGDADREKTEEKRNTIATQMMDNFWDNLDNWKEEMDSLWDSYNESLKSIQENQVKQNEILQKFVDNEMSIEQDIYKAIENRKQSDIDRLTETKEAIGEAAEKFTSGLSEQLKRERDMYTKNQEANDLTKLQRQLAILERSGGSASQIRSLQEQIDNKMQDNYFNSQQDQIDAIKEASDKQIEQLETQIDLMSEALEYQKENGLIWAEVRDVMKLSTNEVLTKLLQWNPDYAQKSALDLNETMRDIEERYQLWDSDRGLTSALQQYRKEILDASNIKDSDKDIVESAYRAAYSRAVASGSIDPDKEARDFAANTEIGLGYHNLSTTTGAATSAYRNSLYNDKSIKSGYKGSMISAYEDTYDTTYAQAFEEAYRNYLTGKGSSYINGKRYQYQGLSDINEASAQQQKTALEFAEIQAKSRAETASTRAANTQASNLETNDRNQGLVNIQNASGTAYSQAIASLGRGFVETYILPDAKTNYNNTYTTARNEGQSVDEAIYAAQQSFLAAVPTETANAGAKTAKKNIKIGSKKLKNKGTGVTITAIGSGGSQVYATYGKYGAWKNIGDFYDLTDAEKIRLPRYKEGGLIDYTGPAIVDGSSTAPESILNAEQTRFLREDLLGNSKTSLKSIVTALQDAMNNTAVSSINNANSVVIENIELTFEAGTIANDYDARRAGNNIAEEIMRIARQVGNNNVSRR